MRCQLRSLRQILSRTNLTNKVNKEITIQLLIHAFNELFVSTVALFYLRVFTCYMYFVFLVSIHLVFCLELTLRRFNCVFSNMSLMFCKLFLNPVCLSLIHVWHFTAKTWWYIRKSYCTSKQPFTTFTKISHVISHVKNIWNGNVFTCEIPISHVKRTGSKFQVWNLGVGNIYFMYEMGHSHMKINFTHGIEIIHEIACEIFVKVVNEAQPCNKVMYVMVIDSCTPIWFILSALQHESCR